MQAGQLRARVVLEAPVRTPDAGGGADVVWTAEASLWARIAPKSGSEAAAGEALVSQSSHEVTIRRRDGVTAEKRFRLGSRILAIRAVRDDGRGRALVCDCEEEQVS